MRRGLIRSLLAALFAAIALAPARAARWVDSSASSPILERFLSSSDPAPVEYRALRHLEAQNDRFNSSAWMDVVTEADRDGHFRYRIVDEGGSPYIRRRVFLPTLDAESAMSCGEPDRGALTPANYIFEDRREAIGGLARLIMKPRRRDILLVDGSIFVNPDDGDLVRLEGRLSKTPSAWTRRVEIVQSFRRFGGVRLPVQLETVATLFIAGRSTFRMTYDYESVNGQRVDDSGKLASR